MDQILSITITVLECVHGFMGYIMDSYHFHGFRSDPGLRNTFGIEIVYHFDLRECTLPSDVAVTLT